ncbi:unnamed protein product [Somion occarium]|uniref:Uncharacterized protein n=1 Tax=Somion occarium TaxID=3059160 RepID=A0ABP1CYP3_9APHY
MLVTAYGPPRVKFSGTYEWSTDSTSQNIDRRFRVYSPRGMIVRLYAVVWICMATMSTDTLMMRNPDIRKTIATILADRSSMQFTSVTSRN